MGISPTSTERVRFALAKWSITSDKPGFSELTSLHRRLTAYTDTSVTIDVSNLVHIDPRMLTPLDVIVRHAERRGNAIQYAGGSANIMDALQNARLSNGSETANSQLSLRRFNLEQAIGLSRYTAQAVEQRGVPAMANSLRMKIYESIDELFSNAALHSNSDLGVSASGSYLESDERLFFAMADGGRGIPGSVRDAQIPYASDEEAIAWAMMENNTTKQSNIPGGLGSVVLCTFVKLNGGRLVIASRKGFWCLTANDMYYKPLPHEYPGTAIILDVVPSDTNEYDPLPGPSPNNIW